MTEESGLTAICVTPAQARAVAALIAAGDALIEAQARLLVVYRTANYRRGPMAADAVDRAQKDYDAALVAPALAEARRMAEED